jgi:hypothetical protein
MKHLFFGARAGRATAHRITMMMLWLVLGSFPLHATNAFERACVPCHQQKQISLRKTFMNALLVYSGEENMKAGLKYFLRHPRRDSSVMSEAFLDEHGLARPITIDDKTLNEALGIYWKRYTVQGKLQ